MNLPLIRLSLFLVSAAALSSAQNAAAPPSWTNTSGVTIHGEFVRLEGQAVVIRKEGKEFKIPFSKLNGESIARAEKLAAAAPAPKPEEPSPAQNQNLPPAKSFGKQTDPDHERKLAESVLAKKGTVEIWRGSGSLVATKPEDLPKGQISLKSVEASGAPFSDEDAALLNGCDKLTKLDLHRATLEGLPLESLPGLEWFQLLNSRIETAALRGLAGNKALREIHIHDTALGLELPDILSSCPNLEVLVLERADLKGVSLLPLARLKLLRDLNVGGNFLGDADLAGLGKFPALETLGLHEINFSDESLGFLPSLKTTRNLNLGRATLPAGAMEKVAAMPTLSWLQLYGSNVTGKDLHALAGSKSLTELLLENTAITAEDFAGMRPMPGIRVVHLDYAKGTINDAGAKAIAAAFPRLESLTGDGGGLGSAGMTALAGINTLADLKFNGLSGLDGPFLEAVGKMKRLSKLCLGRSEVKDEHVALLEPLKSRLQELHLDHTRISDQALKSLAEMKSLRLLVIIGTDISAEGAKSLKASLRGCEVKY